ncbi:MAG: D-aminoacylase [Gammaproteobacteria bacterium]|nr:MAG: D-aminoacylase [Gammaproteobacteria bacterium]TDJ39382.1 MAG: D-aminoacylase [Gammaproteobacteria bacterium]
MHDLVIRNASVYDGTGSAPVITDIAIDGDRIAGIGTPGAAREELDATGLALAPGFIDVHTHDDFAAVLYPDMAFKVCGGVTTCIVGNCGMGAAPFRQAALLARAFHPGQELPDWGDYHGYFDTLDAQPPSVNVGVLVGHGSMRMAAMHRDSGAPSADQMAQMKAILAEGLDAGALGLSTGLIYDPGKYAATEELIELASTLPDGALYATHMRDEGTGLLTSIQEALRIGESAGVPIQISHHKASGHDAWGLVNESLALIDAARARGVSVDADQYPYTAGSTILSAVLAKDVADMRNVRHDDIVIASTAGHSDWEGQSLSQLAQLLELSPEETAQHVLATEPDATVILHSMDENDVQTVLRHPSTMIGSDGIPTLEGRPHPRLYGTFARVLGHYARDLGLFSLEEAVHRMTGLPAAKFGLTDRGEIRTNGYADLVLFDPARVIDVGTFEDPNHYPDGIVHVFVNGRHTVANGVHCGARNGKALRRVSSEQVV